VIELRQQMALLHGVVAFVLARQRRAMRVIERTQERGKEAGRTVNESAACK
jgi:hypothetical protein